MRLMWLTDIHLNFLNPEQVENFARRTGRAGPDAILISGDISESQTLQSHLNKLARHSDATILYVLGNHDFYHDRINDVRKACSQAPCGIYLHGAPPYQLADGVGVVGVDGWADGGYGKPRDSEIVFTDWHLITDFREADAIRNIDARLELLAEQGRESADTLRKVLSQAVHEFERVLVITHVPPSPESAGHNRTPEADLWMPWLACRATGEVLFEFAESYPKVDFEVLCGHTHQAKTTRERSNLLIRTGRAAYRAPEIQRIWSTTHYRSNS